MVAFIKRNKLQIADSIQIFLFFLLGFQFFKLETFISIGIFIISAICLVVKYKISVIKENIGNEIIDLSVLTLFVLSFVVFKTIHSSFSDLPKNAFHFGYLIILFWLASRASLSDFGWKGLTNIISFFIGCFLYISICSGLTFANFGLKSDVRLFLDLWTNNYFSSTIASVYLIPIFVVSLVCVLLLLKKKKYLFAVIPLVPCIISSFISIRLENRGFFVAVLIALLLFCYLVYFQTNDLSNKKKDDKYAVLTYIPFFLSVIFLVLVIFMRFNILGLTDAMKKIPFLNRIVSGGTNAKRSAIYSAFFENFWKFPFGGLKQSGSLVYGDYVHNAFFDIYAVAGLIPMVCFTYFFVRFYYLCVVKKAYRDDFLSFLFLSSMVLSLFAMSLFEPIFDINGYYFASVFGLFSIFVKDYPNRVFLKRKKVKNESPKTN